MKKVECRGVASVRPTEKKDPKQNVGADVSVCPSRETDNKNKGITLIALVITIIVLLILAGVSLKLIAGGDGIIGKAEKAVNAHTEAAALEKLNLELIEYMADRVENADVVLREYLESIDGYSELREDESEDNSGGHIVVVDGYEFRVTADGQILESLGKATSPRISLTQTGSQIEVSMTERGEVVTNLEILDSAENVLETVAKEDMTRDEQAYVVNHTCTATGTYIVKVTTSGGKEYIKQISISLDPPEITLTQTGNQIKVSITEKGEVVTNLEILNSTGQVIASVAKEDMTKNEQAYVVNHTCTATGTYTVKVITSGGKEYTKEVSINLTPPATPVIYSNYGYPLMT